MTSVAVAVGLLAVFALGYLVLLFGALRRSNKIVTSAPSLDVHDGHDPTQCATPAGAALPGARVVAPLSKYACFSTRSPSESERGKSPSLPDTAIATAPVRVRDDRLDDAGPGLSIEECKSSDQRGGVIAASGEVTS